LNPGPKILPSSLYMLSFELKIRPTDAFETRISLALSCWSFASDTAGAFQKLSHRVDALSDPVGWIRRTAKQSKLLKRNYNHRRL